jgi:hypothetical protein
VDGGTRIAFRLWVLDRSYWLVDRVCFEWSLSVATCGLLSDWSD